MRASCPPLHSANYSLLYSYSLLFNYSLLYSASLRMMYLRAPSHSRIKPTNTSTQRQHFSRHRHSASILEARLHRAALMHEAAGSVAVRETQHGPCAASHATWSRDKASGAHL
jgi:hypothetical protein